MKRKESKLLASMLVLCMALVLLPVAAHAAETSGKCGDSVTWAYSDGTLSIQGTGRMYDYADISSGGLSFKQLPWSDYRKQIHTVRIGDGVTSIGHGSFSDFENLTSVSIPSCVTTIGAAAFYRCNMASMTIPDSVISIEKYTFGMCSNLTSVTIPDSVTTIGDYAFFRCESLSNVAIPNSVTTIGEEAFAGCIRLTSVIISNVAPAVGAEAFADCSSLTDIYYGGSESQWNQLKTGSPPSITIHYNSTGPTSSTSNSIGVTVGGKAVEWTDAAPFIDTNSRTMVPLRAVGDAMGLDVNWDAATREAMFTNGSKTIFFPIDSNNARTSDGEGVQMDTAAVIVNDRTYAPIRYLAEYFGYEVGWDAAKRTVIIE